MLSKQRITHLILGLLGGKTASVRVGPAAEAGSYPATNLKAVVGEGRGEVLCISIDGQEINATQVPRNHVVHSISASSSNANHADTGRELVEVALHNHGVRFGREIDGGIRSRLGSDDLCSLEGILGDSTSRLDRLGGLIGTEEVRNGSTGRGIFKQSEPKRGIIRNNSNSPSPQWASQGQGHR